MPPSRLLAFNGRLGQVDFVREVAITECSGLSLAEPVAPFHETASRVLIIKQIENKWQKREPPLLLLLLFGNSVQGYPPPYQFVHNNPRENYRTNDRKLDTLIIRMH